MYLRVTTMDNAQKMRDRILVDQIVRHRALGADSGIEASEK